MEELILIDGNSLLFKAFYATSYNGNFMENKDGIPTNAVFGFARMMKKILERNAKYVLVAFDAGKHTFRNDMLDSYKATRKETPAELVPQFAMVREYLTAHNIAYFEKEGYEGDDIIGTLVKFGESHNLTVSVFTGDKDAFQLCSDHTTIYRTVKGVSELDIYNPATLKEKWDLAPDQIRDMLGLMGDTADNIPGIKGVGEKTALKLLHQYGTIEGIDEHKEEIKGKLGEKVRAGIEDAKMSKEVATILTDIPLDVDLETAHYDGYDFDTLKDFFKKYDMNSLIRDISKEAITPRRALTFDLVNRAPENLGDSALYTAIYDENYHKSIILGFGVYNDTHAFFISFEDALKDQNFLNYLKDASIKKYGFAIKSMINGLRWNGIEISGLSFDLSLATYVLSPSIKEVMKNVADFYGYDDVRYEEEVYGKGAKKHIPETEILARDCVEKARCIYELMPQAIGKLKEAEQYELYENLELPVTYILADMEFAGAKVDENILKSMDQAFDQEIGEIESQIYDLAGENFNISSPKQLGTILFEKLGLKNGKKTKTGYSTSQDILEKNIDAHPIVPLVLRYRMLTKLSSTYLKGLQDQIFPDGKIHTIYKQTLTQTGRLSSVDPNLQNIPVRTHEGKMIRKAFVSDHGYLLSFDYSQIELRILAHLAHVPKLIEAFKADKDIHAHTAALVFGVNDEDVTPEMRRQAKAVNFGIIYGMTEFRLAKDIGMSLDEARDFIARYYATYPEIRTYMEGIVKECEEQGYVSTVLNRKRFIPTIHDKNRMVREQAKRFAMNAPIQGSGADIMKLAMIKVQEAINAHHFKSEIILQVHDELIFDVYKDEIDTFMPVVKEAMETCFALDVPLKVEGNYADNWCDLK